MSNTLYLECATGISGDMAVASLIGLGANQEALKQALSSIPVSGFSIEISTVKKSGLAAWDFNVLLDEEHDNHDHDMNYLFGNVPEHTADHYHEHEGHDHDEHHHSHHHHRTLGEIIEIINKTELTERARDIAIHIFIILGNAEAVAHKTALDQVAFHEVGSVDSIVDIIAVAFCIDNLGITDVIVPELSEGYGTIRCQHGILPIPVPAVLSIIETYGIPIRRLACQGEFVTPTGAAIVAAITTSRKLPQKYVVCKTGLGTGKREYEIASILRAMLICEEEDNIENDDIMSLQTNIDDCSGETLGFVMDALFKAGAYDVFYSPVYMKKNRPAYILNVICSQALVDCMEQIIFSQTTTIGIRKQKMQRSTLSRSCKTFQTAFGEIQVKVCDLSGGQRCYPEYECLANICRETGISYPELYREVMHEINA